MKKIFLLKILGICLVILFMGTSCSKDYSGRLPSPAPSNPGCDTCLSPGLQFNKEVILYVLAKDWSDRGDGRFECDLEPLLGSQASPIEAYNISAMYVGIGRSARQIRRGVPLKYNGGNLAWFGFKIDFKPDQVHQPPESITLKLLLSHL